MPEDEAGIVQIYSEKSGLTAVSSPPRLRLMGIVRVRFHQRGPTGSRLPIKKIGREARLPLLARPLGDW